MNHNTCLKEYANAKHGRPAVIYCCGPSLNRFDKSKLDIGQINIVMKMAILATDKYDNMDYYFFGDKNKKSKPYQKLIAELTCPKFGLTYQNGKEVPETYDADFCKTVGAEALNLSYRFGFKKDISKYPFYRCSTIFPCLQFALFLGCSTIYVVGMDLTQEESFINPAANRGKIFIDKMSDHLSKFMEFKRQQYPKAEVIRVNPVFGSAIFDKDVVI